MCGINGAANRRRGACLFVNKGFGRSWQPNVFGRSPEGQQWFTSVVDRLIS
ncbi:hypothetical protein SynMEDNS5_00713 [Synechococcus sp. MEDNS5]|nr:hypothetical protein SynMEDNS5_00713 [Synechococcus sp. MEDNS5]